MNTQWEGGYLQARKSVPTRTWLHRPPTFRLVRNKTLLFKPPRVCGIFLRQPAILIQWAQVWDLKKKVFIDGKFNWWIIALQYCVDFCQTSAWIIHRYIYVPSFLNLPLHPTHLGCYRASVWVPWVIQQILIGYMYGNECLHVTLSIYPTLSFLPPPLPLCS